MKPLITVCGLWIAVIHSAHAQWFIEAGAGAGFYTKDQTTSFEAFNTKTSSFITTGQTVSDAYQFGLGKQFAIQHPLINAISISGNVYWLRDLKRNGQVISSSSTRYDFKMPLSSYRLMGNVKLNFGRGEKLSPYVLAGAGVALNTTKAFTAASSDNFAPLHFEKNSRNNFAYQAGLGIDYTIKRNWQASLGYLYSHAGKAGPDKLRVNMGELQPANIKFDLTTQEVYLGLRYVFG